jgi:hypothetical protein
LISPQTTITFASGTTNRIAVSAITPLPASITGANWYMTDPDGITYKKKVGNIGAAFNIDTLATGSAPPSSNSTGSNNHAEKGFITGSNGIAITNGAGTIGSALSVTGDIDVTAGVVTVKKVQGIEYDTVDPTNGQAYLYNSTAAKMVAQDVVATNPATATAEGIVRVSVVPVDSAHPIAVGDNDSRVGKVTHGTSFPGSPATNDQFLRDDLNKVYRYSGSAWVEVGGGSTINSGTSFPGSPTTGDLFIRTDENKLYRYNGSSWDATGDGIGTTIGRGTSFPGSPATNDLFIRTDEKKLYRYTGSAWDATGDGVGTTINSGTSFPGSPTTGDLFIRTDQDKLYRYTGSAWNATGDGTGSAASAIAHGTSFPGSPTTNDQFIRDDLNTLSRYDGAAWQTIGAGAEVP